MQEGINKKLTIIFGTLATLISLGVNLFTNGKIGLTTFILSGSTLLIIAAIVISSKIKNFSVASPILQKIKDNPQLLDHITTSNPELKSKILTTMNEIDSITHVQIINKKQVEFFTIDKDQQAHIYHGTLVFENNEKKLSELKKYS